AHSLADVLDAKVTDDPQPVRGGPRNLFVRELDTARLLQAERATIETALSQMTASAHAASRLVDLAPPGSHELFGMLSIRARRRQHEVVVVDMAPTGHALRLLDMPEVAREWTALLMRVLLDYRAVIRPGPLAQELVNASRTTRELQAMIRDHAQTRFLVVTRA